jgi:hypothetical protein
MAAILEAGRNRLAVGWYQCGKGKWQPKGKLELLSPQQLSKRIRQPTYICGELNAGVRRLLQRKWKNVHLASPAQCQRRPAFLAELA